MTNINITDVSNSQTEMGSQWSVPWIILATYVVVGWGTWSFEANLAKTMLIVWNLSN